MKRSAVLALLLLFITSILSASKQNCIIVGSEQRNVKVVDSLKSALEDIGVAVKTNLVSSKGIHFTVDSILGTLSNCHNEVGIIGIGYAGGIAAAEIASKSKPAYLILISTPTVSGERFSQRLLTGPTFSLDLSAKNAFEVREKLKETLQEDDNIISKEIKQYLPKKIFPSINCPVFALTCANDSKLDWYENLSELESILPKSETNWFKVYPQTGYVLLEENGYLPCWLGDSSPYATGKVNPQAIQDICNWITNLKKE